MRFLITGSSGFIGSALVETLRSQGEEVVRLLRTQDNLPDDAIGWDPEREKYNLKDFEHFDAVINLAGENIASGRWTEEKKRKIHDSRVNGTKALCRCLAKLQVPPKVLVSASASGYYGNKGDEVLAEGNQNGAGFLAAVCRDWEAATEPAKRKGIRVVHPRIGMVLAANGGALAKLVTPFKMGLGGVLGSGKQYISWITLDDLLNAILFAIKTESLEGPINVGTPHPVTNEQFTKTLGEVLNRPTVMSVPDFAAKLAFGEMADEVLLSSVRMLPVRLREAGFAFKHPEIKEALREVLK